MEKRKWKKRQDPKLSGDGEDRSKQIIDDKKLYTPLETKNRSLSLRGEGQCFGTFLVILVSLCFSVVQIFHLAVSLLSFLFCLLLNWAHSKMVMAVFSSQDELK